MADEQEPSRSTSLASMVGMTPLGPLLVLRPFVILTWLVTWNVVGGLGIYFNGGMGQVTHPVSRALWLANLLFLAACCALVLASDRVRERWCRPGANYTTARYGFFVLAAIACLLGAMMVQDWLVA